MRSWSRRKTNMTEGKQEDAQAISSRSTLVTPFLCVSKVFASDFYSGGNDPNRGSAQIVKAVTLVMV